jgi:prolipoprotein diacylglyceryltransferase
MSAATATRAVTPATTTATLRELALADARRYSRHPLFLVGALLSVVFTSLLAVLERSPDPLGNTVVPAFFIGVLGFVVAHRLTTSLRRSHELVGALPASARQRTLALCLA